MQRIIEQARGAVFGTLSVPLMLAVISAPVVIPLVLITFFSDSPSDLTSDCEPQFIQDDIVECVAPTRFWKKQEKALAASLERPFVAPSAQMREETAKLSQTLTEIRKEVPTPPVSYPDQLRAQADRIEQEHALRALDIQAYGEWQQHRAFAQRCLARARAEISKRS